MVKNKKKKLTEKQHFLKFIVLIIVALLVGGVLGYLTAWFVDEGLFKGFSGLTNWFTVINPIIFAVFNIVLAIISFVTYAKAKKKYELADGEDEEIYDIIDYKLNTPLLLSNIAVISNMALMATGVYSASKSNLDDNVANICYFANIGLFFVGYIWVIYAQSLAIKLCKKINPEKQGSIFDTNFKKEWEDSCDEAQKLVIYKSAYKSFSATNFTCMVMWLVAVFGMLSFDTGVFPVILICIIFMVSNISYILAAMKAEKPQV